MSLAANQEPAGVSEPVPALGTRHGHRFVDWAAHLSVFKVCERAHLGLCFPAKTQPGADRSLSGSTYSPEASRDDQRGFLQPSKTNLSAFKGGK